MNDGASQSDITPGQLAPLFVVVQASAICRLCRALIKVRLPAVPAWFGFNADTQVANAHPIHLA